MAIERVDRRATKVVLAARAYAKACKRRDMQTTDGEKKRFTTIVVSREKALHAAVDALVK